MSHAAAALIVLGAMALAGAGVFAVRRAVPLDRLKGHHEIAVPVFLQVGVAYAVLLAFVTTITWDQHGTAARAVDEEVAKLLVVANLARGFQGPARDAFGEMVLDYARAVAEDEWAAMRDGAESPHAAAALQRLWDAAATFEPQPGRETVLYSAMLRSLGEAREQRRLRLFHANLAVPGAIWVLLVATGIGLVGLAYFFGMEDLWSQAVLTAALAGSITTVLVLILLLDFPFSGDQLVPPDAFRNGLQGLAETPR